MRRPMCWRIPSCGERHLVDEMCRGGSMVERGFRKAQVAGSSPARGFKPGVVQKVERRPSGSEIATSSSRRPVQGARMSVLGCRVCGEAIVQPDTGRKRLTCSDACRKKASRKKP